MDRHGRGGGGASLVAMINPSVSPPGHQSHGPKHNLANSSLLTSNILIGKDLGSTLPLGKNVGSVYAPRAGSKELHGIGLIKGSDNGQTIRA